MDNGRLHKFASKRVTAWSKQTLPGWWTMLTVLIGAGFFLYLAHAFIAGPADGPGAHLPPLAAPAPAPATASATTTATSTSPTTASAPAPAGSVTLPGAGGGTRSVPAAAAALARLSFQALYDPAAAAQVPTSDGGHHQAPAQPGPGTVSGLAVVSTDPGGARVQFSATVDIDGPHGPLKPVPTYLSVAQSGAAWVLLNTAG